MDARLAQFPTFRFMVKHSMETTAFPDQAADGVVAKPRAGSAEPGARVKHSIASVAAIPKTLVIAAITVYQQTLSPDHGPLRHLHRYGYCRHEPTCSEYGKQIIEQRGVLRGTPLLLWRVLHCHPWAKVSDEKIRSLLRRTNGAD